MDALRLRQVDFRPQILQFFSLLILATSSIMQFMPTLRAVLWNRLINALQCIKRCHIALTAGTEQLFILVINNDLVFRIFAQNIRNRLILTHGSPPLQQQCYHQLCQRNARGVFSIPRDPHADQAHQSGRSTRYPDQ